MSRDMRIPMTESEYAELEKIWASKESYCEKDGSISTSDFTQFAADMRLDRTPSQLEAHIEIFNKFFGGRATWKIFVDLSSKFTAEDRGPFYAAYVQIFDKNGDGFITSDEMQGIVDYMTKFEDEKYASLSFEDFKNEADVNRDGKVSVEECVAWIQKVTS